MSKFSAADVLELPVQERLQLVEDIWNSIADVPEALALTEEDKLLIDQRLEAHGAKGMVHAANVRETTVEFAGAHGQIQAVDRRAVERLAKTADF